MLTTDKNSLEENNQKVTEPRHPEIEQHIENNDQEALMEASIIYQTRHSNS